MLEAKITQWLGTWKMNSKSSYLNADRTMDDQESIRKTESYHSPVCERNKRYKTMLDQTEKESNGEKLNYDKDDCEREYLEYMKQIEN